MSPERRTTGPLASAYLRAVALLAGVARIVLAVGGVWPLWLGGSFHYAVAGLGLLATAWLMAARRLAAVATRPATHLCRH